MTYTLEIPLNAKGYEDYLEKRFKYGYKLKREVTNYFNRQEYRRRQSDDYKYLAEEQKALTELQQRIAETKDKEAKKALKAQQKALSEELKQGWVALNNAFNLNSGKFVKYKELGQASNMYERYAAEGIINWATFENIAQTVKAAYLQRRGQHDSDNYLKVQRYIDFTTLWYRKCNTNIKEDGVLFGPRNTRVKIPYAFRRDDEVKLTYALERQKLALYALKRKLVKDGTWKYSILLVFDGVPYGVDTVLKNKGKVEITLQVEQMAIKAENLGNGKSILFDLSNDFGFSEKLSELDREIEHIRRVNNPDNYNEDGTNKAGRLKWVYTNHYKKLLNQKRYLWHKITKSRKNRFGQIANEIMELGDEFIIYKDDFKSLQKRKDYDPETMKWYDKRKQKGFEIMFNAPYEFLQVLETKLNYLDVPLEKYTTEKKK